MEIKNFITMVLNELQELKTTDNKRNYQVDNLEFELGITVSKDVNGNAKLSVKNILIGSLSGEISNNISDENFQKVKIKLTPKRQ